MKRKAIPLLICLVLIIQSCKKNDTKALDNFEQKLVGSWESVELEDDGTSFSHKELMLTDQKWHLNVFAYSDIKGHYPLFHLELEGTYEITDASSTVEGSWNGTYNIDQKHLTLLTYNHEIIQGLGFEPCGLTYGERTNVSNGCSFVESVTDCAVDYDLVTIKDGMLYAGKRNPDMCMPEGRPESHGSPFKRIVEKKANTTLPSPKKEFLRDAKIELLSENLQFLEGPIWDTAKGRLIFSEVNGNVLWQWSEETGLSKYLEPSYYAGGNVFDASGHIISCQGGARRVVKIDSVGNMSVLVDTFEGKKFNSPNDAVVKSDGTIWFTDPDYGLLAVFGADADKHRELEGNYIFMYDPASNTIKMVCNSLSKPNGLAFSKDETKLYVGNSKEGDRRIMVFDVLSSNTLGKTKLVATIKSKTWGVDGLKVGEDGNLYAACGDGVNIFSPSGKLIHVISTDFEVTNLSFGSNNETLFLTGHEALYKATIKNY
ncbi:MAG: SMP-30/gluconolactonase/LRE family protein [Bacteroidota bacterium]